jgi:adenylate cyclase
MTATRRLAAILVADVVGYSRLMETDETGTHKVLKQRRKTILEPVVKEHGGRIVKLMGDGVLIEFASAVNAVKAALELQEKFSQANADQPEDRRIVLRIGINLGDVIGEGSDIYGDGVNIAARLESLAEPGGICVSAKVHEEVRGKTGAAFVDLGEKALKNIGLPVRVFLARPEKPSAAPVASTSGKPSIALLPFVNMSGDAAQDFLSDGITENIITGLSRFRDLTVIASNSTFVYKGKAAKVQDVSRELGVAYVLEGSVQSSGERIRITAQLIDGSTGAHVWAERFDRGIENVFDVQDEVTEMIVGRLATAYGGRLGKAWQGRAARTGLQNFQAYDYFQRGMEAFNKFTPGCTEAAREHFFTAVEFDPTYGKPYAKIAWTYLCDVWLGWSEDAEADQAKALRFANLAIERDDDEAWGYWALAGCHMIRGKYDRAIASYRKALELNPNDADVLNDFGQCLSYSGQAKEGVEMVRKAMRLNPHYPEYWLMQLGPIYFDARQYEDAVVTLESLRLLDTVGVQLYLAASHAALSHDDAARIAVSRVLGFDPDMTLQKCAAIAPYKELRDLEHLRKNLRKAGLPE